MQRPRRVVALVALSTLLLLTCAPGAPAPAAPAGTGSAPAAPGAVASEAVPLTVEGVASLPIGPDRQRILEEGARREGQLLLYTSSSGSEPLIERFMQQYPFIKMDGFSTRSEALVQRTQAESKAGRLTADVLKSNVVVYEELKDLFTRFNSPSASFEITPNAATVEYTGIAFAYSKPRVAPADVPSTVEDLLLPRWRQAIGLMAPPNSFAGRWVGALLDHLGEPATRDYLRKLGDQRPYFHTQPEQARNGLLAGEWDISMQGITGAVTSARKGEPVGWVALDPTTLSPDFIGLFKTAPHPYSAMLFLDWLTSAEGQRALGEAQASVSPEEIQTRQKDGQRLPQRLTFQSPGDAAKLDGWTKLFEELVMRK
jgi:iron(III) transport system substrate-binding protein